MASNQKIIRDRLANDSILGGTLIGTSWNGLARGGIYDKKIKRDGPGDTPNAFDQSAAGVLVVKPCIVVLDRGDSPHIQRDSIPSAYQQSIFVYFYASATTDGRAAIAAMRARTFELLDEQASGWIFASEGGPMVFCYAAERFGVRDDEVFPEAVIDYQRYRLTSRYANLV